MASEPKERWPGLVLERIEKITQPSLQHLIDAWKKMDSPTSLPPVDAWVPTKSSLNIAVLKPILRYIFMMDVTDGGKDYRHRLIGTAISDMHKADLTGQLLSEIPDLWGPAFKDFMDETCTGLVPVAWKGYWPGLDRHGIEVVHLPLGDGTSKEVKTILGAIRYYCEEQDPMSFERIHHTDDVGTEVEMLKWRSRL